MDVSSDQLRAARALLRMEQAEVAARAHVAIVTIRRLEAPGGDARVGAETVRGVRRVLEQAGAEFIAGGVRRSGRTPERSGLFERLQAISRQSASALGGGELLTDADLYDEDGLPG